jgi:imidazole glycerol-phosphate synthase subunit HisH
MIGIIDYGVGNIKAFSNIYNKLNVPHKYVSMPEDFQGISKIILPGVGAFDYAMQQLQNSGIQNEIINLTLNKKLPLLGVCVGMQMFAQKSEEGNLPGLNWIDSTVDKFDYNFLGKNNPLPHMGWNSIEHNNHPLFNGIDNSSKFYFLHSYFFNPKNSALSIASTNYGIEFCSAVSYENIFGVQFHPEKSHQSGTLLLKNFALI